MHRSVSSSKIYRMSTSRASRKGDSLLYENGTENFVPAINSEFEHYDNCIVCSRNTYMSANKSTIMIHKTILNSVENLYRRDTTSDGPSGCVRSVFFFFFFFFFFGGGGGGVGRGGLARRYQIASVICYIHLKL